MAKGLNPQEARKFYDKFGKKQDAQAFYEDAATTDLIAQANFGQASAIFEFGCGTGRFAQKLLEKHLPPTATYLGLDISPKMVELATERLKLWQARATVQLYENNSGLPVPDHSVEYFVSTYVFDLLAPQDIGRLLAEARRSLAQNGRLCLVSLTYGVGPLSRAVAWGWERVYLLRPQLVGGCHPIRLLDYLPSAHWKIEYRQVVTAYGIPSEVVVAKPA